METFLTALHIFNIVVLVLVVLIQSGKGAEISASFSGSSQTVFGSSGGANFFTRFTAGTAVVFMVTSIGLTILNAQSSKSVFEGAETPAATDGAPSAPVSDAAPAGDAAPAADAKAAETAPETK